MRLLMTIRGRRETLGRVRRRISSQPGVSVVGFLDLSASQVALCLLVAGPRATADLAAELALARLAGDVLIEQRLPDPRINRRIR
jgi:hypothetical protein